MTCRLLYVEQLNAVCETSGHLAIITTAVISRLFTGSAPVHHTPNSSSRSAKNTPFQLGDGMFTDSRSRLYRRGRR